MQTIESIKNKRYFIKRNRTPFYAGSRLDEPQTGPFSNEKVNIAKNHKIISSSEVLKSATDIINQAYPYTVLKVDRSNHQKEKRTKIKSKIKEKTPATIATGIVITLLAVGVGTYTESNKDSNTANVSNKSICPTEANPRNSSADGITPVTNITSYPGTI